MKLRLLLTLMLIGCQQLAFGDYEWIVVPDRINNPLYAGPSGLTCFAEKKAVRIWGSNLDTPADATIPDDAELFWSGIAAESANRFSEVTVELVSIYTGTGSGYQNGIVLWQDYGRYIIYGVVNAVGGDYPVLDWPSRFTALGGWPNPDVAPLWTPLSESISDPSGPHSYKVAYDGNTVNFWLDDTLLDTIEYPMDSVKIRLAAYARGYADTVEVSYRDIKLKGKAAKP